MIAFKNRSIHGQKQGTCSRAVIDRVHEQARIAAGKYQAAQMAKLRLAGPGEWEKVLRVLHQENRIYIIEEKNWRIILYYLEFGQINANYMNLHFLLNQKGPRKF